MARKGVLNREQRRFVVVRLACFETPTEVAAAVKEEFGLEVERQLVARYNPEARGSETAKEWRLLFAETRRAYIEDLAGVAIAGQAFRVRELEKLYTQAKRSRNSKLAAEILRQAAEELGGVYTNTRALTGPGGAPLAPPVLNVILEGGKTKP